MSLRSSAAARFAAKPPSYVVSNPNVKFFKSALPFIAFCVVGTFFVTRFQSEKLYQSDKARSSMSVGEAKRKEQEAAAELEVCVRIESRMRSSGACW